MTWIGLVNNEPMYGYPHNEIVYTCVSVGLGLVGAFLFLFLFGISLYFIGGLAGLFLAVFILSWKENLVIQIVSVKNHALTCCENKQLLNFIARP